MECSGDLSSIETVHHVNVPNREEQVNETSILQFSSDQFFASIICFSLQYHMLPACAKHTTSPASHRHVLQMSDPVRDNVTHQTELP